MSSPLTPEQAYDFVTGTFDPDLDEMDRLYQFYCSHERGEDQMPYGVAKARTGDPDQWIERAIRRDIIAETGMPWDELVKLAEVARDANEFGFVYRHEALHRAIARTPIPTLTPDMMESAKAFIERFGKDAYNAMEDARVTATLPTPESWAKVGEIIARGTESKH